MFWGAWAPLHSAASWGISIHLLSALRACITWLQKYMTEMDRRAVEEMGFLEQTNQVATIRKWMLSWN